MTNKLTAARLVPRVIAGATVSAYEAALRSITDLERIAARTTTPEPLGVLAAALADLARDDHHDPPKGGVFEFFRMYRAAFPNLPMEPEHVLASGDMVVARARATGTHRGELMGMPATGRSVDVQLIDIMRCDEDGLVAAQWGVVDMLAVMQQLGVAGVRNPASDHTSPHNGTAWPRRSAEALQFQAVIVLPLEQRPLRVVVQRSQGGRRESRQWRGAGSCDSVVWISREGRGQLCLSGPPTRGGWIL